MQVSLIDHMGSDLSVVNAARVSFDKESDWVCIMGHDGVTEYTPPEGCDPNELWLSKADQRLIAFLAKHNHWSPFSHTSLSFRIKAPIFVARQLGKHQVGLSWNEVSRRYVDAEPEFYIPETWRERAADKKQGSSDTVAFGEDIAGFKDFCDHAKGYYQDLLDSGVCPEQARMVLPQSMMTEWIWTGSLYAYARVCNLRLKADTQAETRVIAQDISEAAAKVFPESWKVLVGEV